MAHQRIVGYTEAEVCCSRLMLPYLYLSVVLYISYLFTLHLDISKRARDSVHGGKVYKHYLESCRYLLYCSPKTAMNVDEVFLTLVRDFHKRYCPLLHSLSPLQPPPSMSSLPLHNMTTISIASFTSLMLKYRVLLLCCYLSLLFRQRNRFIVHSLSHLCIMTIRENKKLYKSMKKKLPTDLIEQIEMYQHPTPSRDRKCTIQ